MTVSPLSDEQLERRAFRKPKMNENVCTSSLLMMPECITGALPAQRHQQTTRQHDEPWG